MDLVNRVIKLPKLKWISIRGYRNISHISGNIDKKYKNLNERVYKCFNCGIKIDRYYLNASINIVFEGLKLNLHLFFSDKNMSHDERIYITRDEYYRIIKL